MVEERERERVLGGRKWGVSEGKGEEGEEGGGFHTDGLNWEVQ